jgi:hypothetical protein
MTEETYLRTLEFLERFGSVVILPIAIVWLTQWWTKKQKKDDQNFEISKLKETKGIESEFQLESDKKNHEKIVHSSLLKILFQVQKLHISLSGSCVDTSCIDTAINDFNQSLNQHQSIISDNQIFLSSKTTNNLYRFYSLIGELLIELREIRDKKMFELAIVSVWEYSQRLADSIIDIQDEFVQKRKDLTEKFDKLEVPYFRSCCGHEPSPELKQKIEIIRNQKLELEKHINQLPNPIEEVKLHS